MPSSASMRIQSATLFPYTTLFRSIRHYGLFASNKRDESIARTRQLLAVPKSQSENAAADADSNQPQTPAHPCPCCGGRMIIIETFEDRKSTRLNSSHTVISYAVFCFYAYTECNTLSLHDALPIYPSLRPVRQQQA